MIYFGYIYALIIKNSEGLLMLIFNDVSLI